VLLRPVELAHLTRMWFFAPSWWGLHSVYSIIKLGLLTV
jgi:hypothetical protein